MYGNIMDVAMRERKETLINFSNQDRVGKTNLCWKRGGVSESGPTSVMSERLLSQPLKKDEQVADFLLLLYVTKP